MRIADSRITIAVWHNISNEPAKDKMIIRSISDGKYTIRNAFFVKLSRWRIRTVRETGRYGGGLMKKTMYSCADMLIFSKITQDICLSAKKYLTDQITHNIMNI